MAPITRSRRAITKPEEGNTNADNTNTLSPNVSSKMPTSPQTTTKKSARTRSVVKSAKANSVRPSRKKAIAEHPKSPTLAADQDSPSSQETDLNAEQFLIPKLSIHTDSGTEGESKASPPRSKRTKRSQTKSKAKPKETPKASITSKKRSKKTANDDNEEQMGKVSASPHPESNETLESKADTCKKVSKSATKTSRTKAKKSTVGLENDEEDSAAELSAKVTKKPRSKGTKRVIRSQTIVDEESDSSSDQTSDDEAKSKTGTSESGTSLLTVQQMPQFKVSRNKKTSKVSKTVAFAQDNEMDRKTSLEEKKETNTPLVNRRQTPRRTKKKDQEEVPKVVVENVECEDIKEEMGEETKEVPVRNLRRKKAPVATPKSDKKADARKEISEVLAAVEHTPDEPEVKPRLESIKPILLKLKQVTIKEELETPTKSRNVTKRTKHIRPNTPHVNKLKEIKQTKQDNSNTKHIDTEEEISAKLETNVQKVEKDKEHKPKINLDVAIKDEDDLDEIENKFIAIKKNNVQDVYGFGFGENGELGYWPDFKAFMSPIKIDIPVEIKQISTGSNHTAVVDAHGMLYTFGRNELYALGRISKSALFNLYHDAHCYIVPDARKVKQVAAGNSFTVWIDEKHNLFAVGGIKVSDALKVGFDTREGKPSMNAVQIQGVYEKVKCGANFVLMSDQNKQLFSFGLGNKGQLGRYICKDEQGHLLSMEPKLVDFGQDDFRVLDFWCGFDSAFALSEDHRLFAWGDNTEGQLALENENKYVTEPQEVTFFSENNIKISRIEMGLAHTLVLSDKGTLYSFGSNKVGQLGNDQASDLKMAEIVKCFQNNVIVDIACGKWTSYAITDQGELYSWGIADYQLGTKQVLKNAVDFLPPQLLSDHCFGSNKLDKVVAGNEFCLVISK